MLLLLSLRFRRSSDSSDQNQDNIEYQKMSLVFRAELSRGVVLSSQ